MKPFRFPLQAVLTVRMDRETKALEAFALAQAEFEKIVARFRQIQKEIEDVFDCRRAALKATANSEDVQQMQQGLRALQETSQRCKTQLERAQAILDEKSKSLLAARQEREIVEKVHQRQLARHRLQAARQEQRVLDDLATLKSIGDFALKWR
jgi:flagellar export protein FliJ